MREEIVRILKQGRAGVKVTSNGIANFIEYPISIEQLAGQILAIMRARIEGVKQDAQYSWDGNRIQGDRQAGFEDCRREVLKLFSEVE